MQRKKKWVKFYLLTIWLVPVATRNIGALKEYKYTFLKIPECWKKEKDRAKKHMPKNLQDKLDAGQNLTDYERSKFENEYGGYKSRNETVVIDLIHAINQG